MTQYAVPNADTDTGGWTKYPHTVLYYAKIDETPVASADDGDYIEAVELEEELVDGTATFALSAITDPENNVNHFVRYRAEDSSGTYSTTPSFNVKLYQSSISPSNLIASKRHTGGTVITSNDPPFANYSIELSTSEADSITDYSDLKLTIIMENDGDENSAIRVSQLFFETDDAGGGGGGGSVATTGGGPDSFSIGGAGFGSNFSLE